MTRTRVVVMCLCALISAGAGTAWASGAYAVDAGIGTSGVYSLDLVSGDASALLLTPDIQWFGAASGPEASWFFATPAGGDLYRIETDGVTATVAPIMSYGGIEIRDLGYDQASDALYGTTDTAVYRIDYVAGTVTPLGDFASQVNRMWALDYDPVLDKLVGVDSASDTVYYIDTLTGALTYVGPSGDRITDIWFDSSSQTMYGVSNPYYNASLDEVMPSRLFTLDTSTGVATVVTTITPPGFVQGDLNLLGLAPEPTTVAFLVLGGLAGLRRRRR